MKHQTESSAPWLAHGRSHATQVPGRRASLVARSFVPLCALLLAAGAWQAGAMTPPQPGELAGYAEDGSLAARVAFAKDIGNDKFDPELILQTKFKMQRLLLEAQGIDPATAAGIAAAPPPNWRGMPTTGTIKVLCLLIEFNDYVHNAANTPTAINNALFGAGLAANAPYESLTNYYKRSSYNKLTLQGNTLGWYRTSYNRSAVAQNAGGRQGLIQEVMNHYAGLGHDFSQYDNDGDGDVDMFYVIYAGPDNGWGNFWWAYQPTWQNTWPFSYKVSGKTLSKYAFQFQFQNSAGQFSPNVIIHETGHALGIPDYYDYDGNVGPDGGVGGLDMMDGNRGDHNCFSKWTLGWLTPTMVGSYGSQTLQLRASGTYEDCVMIIPGASAAGQFSEYFMVQNRTKEGNDNASNWPGSGMMIWHLDATAGDDYAYNNSYTAHKMLRLMEADGLEQIEKNAGSNAGDFYAAGRAFTPTGVPNSSLYNGNPSWVSVTNFTPAQPAMRALFTINYSAPPNVPPGVAITSPAGGFASPQGATIAISANAYDITYGLPASVAFYSDGTLISTDTIPPYAASWIGAAVGSHVLTAVATGYTGLTTTATPVAISVTAVSPPANDNFSGRIAISGNVNTVTGTNVSSSVQASEPSHAGQPPQKSVWWTWTPSITGTATITTAGSNYDTILAAYTGSAIGSLVAKASNDDVAGSSDRTSSVVFAVEAGAPIQIAVDGYNGATGTITLNVSVVYVPPGNDMFSGATVISNASSPVTVTGTNNGATAQTGEPPHAGNGPTASVWWKWTAPSTGTLQVSTTGSTFDTVLGVYTGSAVTALTVRASNDDTGGMRTSEVSLAVTGGTTYFIAVDGYYGVTGNITLQTSFYDINDPPTISLSSPLNGESIGLNTYLHLSADAYDPEGQVKEVRFYLNGTLVATLRPDPGGYFSTYQHMTVAGYYTVTATVEDNLGLTASATATVLVSAITLPEALNNYSLGWVSGGTQSWSGTATNSHDGVSSAVSGRLGNSQQSWFSTNVTGPGNIACWWSVSSEVNYDFLTFYIDGVAQAGKISGTVGWTHSSWNIPAGTHTLKWQYEKDGSYSAGSDAGWVDEVVWLTPPVLAGASAVTAPTGVPLTYTLSANVSVAGYSVASGALPDGLTLNPTTGAVTGSPLTAGTFNVTLQGINAAGSGTLAVTFTIFAALPIPISVETPPLYWTTGGDSVWYGESTSTHDGVDAVQNGDIADSQSVWAQTYVTGPGTLTFWWKVSSEANYDYLRFFMDGVEQGTAPRISGEVDWQPITVTVPVGNHALRWTYSKDSSVSTGADAAWLDQVVFAPDLPQALDTPALTWTTSGNANWAGQILTTHDGVDAAQSGLIANLQQSITETTVTGAGSLSFWWKVSSEAGWDFLRFYLDGVEQPGIVAISGEVDWQQQTLAVPAGSHTLRWTYSKDYSNSVGLDAAWLDQVVFTSFNFTAPGTTVGRSLWNRPDAGTPPAVLSSLGTAVAYDMMRFTVSTTGTYTLKSTSTNPALWDNYLLLYSVAFNPAAPLANVLVGNDDYPGAGVGTAGFATTLTAGTTYFLVTSGYRNTDAGAYTLDISGAGSVEVTLTVSGTTAGRPTWHRLDQNGANPPTVPSTIGTAVPFDAVSFTVSASGNYTMKSSGTWDNYLFLHATGFDPANPQSNTVIGNDDYPGIGVAGCNVTLYAGTTYFLVTSGFQNYHAGKYTLEITGPGRPQADSALENWRLTWFGSKANSGDGADSNDYDHDGISNFLEFAFGLNPMRDSSGLLPRMQKSGANYAATFTQPDGVTGVTYGAEWSTTLQPASWSAIPDTGVAPLHTFSIPTGRNPKLFLRLKTTAP
ncbi:MAG: M6 family metalloprotease domain-containing protein [Verrucomicrobia bacterium]|nr:M6 family metalloprotease domain-containing protein [Verrucomicrobiota bacterium]